MPVILPVLISPICLYRRMIALKNQLLWLAQPSSVYLVPLARKGSYDLRFPMIRGINHFAGVESSTPVSIELPENGLRALFSDELFPSIRQNTVFYLYAYVAEQTPNLVFAIRVEESDWVTRTVFVETLRLATTCRVTR